jgi:ABC-type cobalamin/Fe3+-siderophores transport system ATPase subunit
MSDITISLHNVSAHLGHRQIFHSVSFDVRAGQIVGVTGPAGAGTSVLLRMLAGAVAPTGGDIRVNGLPPRIALARVPAAYFAGEATLPPFVRAHQWCALWTSDAVTNQRLPWRRLPRGERQLLGLRAQLSRRLALVLLDDPWEALDIDGVRWLEATLEAKRDRGAAIVVSSRRLERLAGLCDKFLFLMPYAPVLVAAHEISATGRPAAETLQTLFDRLLSEPSGVLARWATGPAVVVGGRIPGRALRALPTTAASHDMTSDRVGMSSAENRRRRDAAHHTLRTQGGASLALVPCQGVC